MSRFRPLDRSLGVLLGPLLGAALLLWLMFPVGAAAASIEDVRIREVFPGSTARPEQEWVELQLETTGEYELVGHKLTFYDPQGFEVHEIPLQNVANGESQHTVLVASSNSGLDADIEFAPNLDFGGTGGAVCLESIDCVSWGTATQLTPNTPSPVGTTAAQIPDGSALIRTIARGCSTLLDAADDTNDSSADFAVGAAAPRNNATVPTETACPTGGGQVPGAPEEPASSGSGSGSGSSTGTSPSPGPTSTPVGDTTPPQTKIARLLRSGTNGRSVTVRFGGTDNLAGGLTFRCRIDKKPFQRCTSGKTYNNLSPGRHLIEVEAVDSAGNVDPSPAKDHVSIGKSPTTEPTSK